MKRKSYISLLLEDYNQTSDICFSILFEGYNPEAVKANAELFSDLAEQDGMKISKEFNISNRPKQKLCSLYFYVQNDDNSWKIRSSDHNKNILYDNSVNFYITNDKFDKTFVSNKYKEFKNMCLNFNKKKKLALNMIENSNLCENFIKNYCTNPTWFPKLLLSFGINPELRKYDWFKYAFKNKCNKLCKNNKELYNLYKDTRIFYWEHNIEIKTF